MRKIQLNGTIKKLHLRYWKTKIINRLNRVQNVSDDNLRAYLEYCKKHWRVLAVGEVACLRRIQEELIHRTSAAFMNNLNTQKYLDKKGKEHTLLGLFGYYSFSRLKSTKADIDNALCIVNQAKKGNEWDNIAWNPYVFLFMLPLRTCPYCNRQYITPFMQDETSETSEKKMRADLDHFWPKAKYPHFSMSLYNLVPSCKFCNSSLKYTREFTLENLSPYECNYDDYFRFDFDWKDINFSSISIKTDVIDERIRPFLDMFAIEELYKYHANVAQEFIQKRICYPDELLENLLHHFKRCNLYNSIDDLKAVLIGFPPSKDKIDDEALGKLKYDLACEIGFVHSTRKY